MSNRVKPTSKWLSFDMKGVNGLPDAASQTSWSDICSELNFKDSDDFIRGMMRLTCGPHLQRYMFVTDEAARYNNGNQICRFLQTRETEAQLS